MTGLPDAPSESNITVQQRGDSLVISGSSENRTDKVSLEQVSEFQNTHLGRFASTFVRSLPWFVSAFFALPIVGMAVLLIIHPLPQDLTYVLILFFALWSTTGLFFVRLIRSTTERETAFAQQPWELKISEGTIWATQTKGANRLDHRIVSVEDIRSIETTDDGYLVANTSLDAETETILTGALSPTESTWLQQIVQNAVDRIQASSEKIQATQTDQLTTRPVPRQFVVQPSPESSTLAIRHQEPLITRIVTSILTHIIAAGLGAMFLGMAKKWPSELVNFPFESLATNVLVLVAVCIVAWCICQSLWFLFGSTYITAKPDVLTVRKSILFVGIAHQIPRNEIEHFEQIEHRPYDEDDTGNDSPPRYSIDVRGRKSRRLIFRSGFAEADWLIRELSEFFDVPVVRTAERK